MKTEEGGEKNTNTRHSMTLTFERDLVHVDVVVVELSPAEHHKLLDEDVPDVL